jgi:hypothetical protein
MPVNELPAGTGNPFETGSRKPFQTGSSPNVSDYVNQNPAIPVNPVRSFEERGQIVRVGRRW